MVDEFEGILMKARRWNDCTKEGCSHGGTGLTISECHYHTRKRMYDEFGIGFNNPEIQVTPAPVISLMAKSAISRNKHSDVGNYVYTQFFKFKNSALTREDWRVVPSECEIECNPNRSGFFRLWVAYWGSNVARYPSDYNEMGRTT